MTRFLFRGVSAAHFYCLWVFAFFTRLWRLEHVFLTEGFTSKYLAQTAHSSLKRDQFRSTWQGFPRPKTELSMVAPEGSSVPELDAWKIIMTGPIEFEDRRVTPAANASAPPPSVPRAGGAAGPAALRLAQGRRPRPDLEAAAFAPADRAAVAGYWEEILPHVHYLREGQKKELFYSLQVAYHYHNGQKRKSGEPYIIHPVAVCILLADIQMDAPTLQAGLLHDTVEDTALSFAEIEEWFGPTVKRIVEGETKVSKLPKLTLADESKRNSNRAAQDTQAENLRQMFLAMTEDYRIILVKLADRLHNMRTLRFMPPAKQVKIARETLDIFAPLAHRLGLWTFKTELEEHAFRALHPGAEQDLRAQIQSREILYEESLKVCRELMEAQFEHDPFFKLQNVTATIQGRQKELYSLWNKLKDPKYKGTLDNVKDTVALRVILKYAKQEGELDAMYQNRGMYLCYHVLALVQNLPGCVPALGAAATPVKDYIAVPKPNGYRSLHTNIMHRGQVVEVQIRTEEMHRQAEFGMAAHWIYKTPGSEGQSGGRGGGPADGWMTLIQDWNKEIKNSREFVDTIRREILGKRVLVFDQDGKILNLVRGATVVDAAFHIHSEVGFTMAGATVNGNRVDHSYELRNGDVVLINTDPAARPAPEWLRYAKHRSTRTKLRGHFRQQRRAALVAHGQEVLHGFMAQYRAQIQEARGSVPGWFELGELVRAHGGRRYRDLDDLCFYLALATGERDVRRVMAKMMRLDRSVFRGPFLALHGADADADGLEADGRPKLELWEFPNPEQERAKSVYSTYQHELEEISEFQKSSSMAHDMALDRELSDGDQYSRNKIRNLCPYCNPIWGDEIIGTLDQRGRITLHRENCPLPKTLTRANPSGSKTEMESAAARSAANETEWSAAAAAVGEAKVIAVKWMEMEKNRVYPIDLEVKARDRRFLLSDASTVVSSKAFITDTWSKTIGIVAILRYTVELNDLEHLNDLVESILSIDGVISCQRLIRRKL